jgi:hypothetical protein
MSLSFGSLASTAVSTFKGLAVAAAGTEERPAASGDSTPAASVAAAADAAASAQAVPAPVVAAPASTSTSTSTSTATSASASVERSEPKAVKRRLGSVLDAYA